MLADLGMPLDHQKVSESPTGGAGVPELLTSSDGVQLAHVLIAAVDDRTRTARGRQLQARGLRVLLARTGFEAIVKASCHIPSLIVLDASLGDTEIEETSRLLATCPVTAHIPIVRVAPRRSVPRRMLQQIAAAAL